MSGTKTRKRADDKFDRYAWRDAVFADTKTPTNAKVLAFGIARHVNGETGEAVVSTPKLAEVCGLSATWVRNAIPVLHNIGWAVITIGSKGRGKDHCNVYRINPEKRTPSALLKRPENRTRGAILERAGKSNLLRLKSHFLRQKAHPVCEEPHNPFNPKERGFAARAADADSQSIANSTSDDAPIPATDEPVARTADAALQQPLTEPEQLPSCINPIGTPANGADAHADDRFTMEFERLAREYPRVADKAAALRAFDAAVRARGVTRVGIEITTMMQERGSDVSDFADALLTIERDLAITTNKPADRMNDD